MQITTPALLLFLFFSVGGSQTLLAQAPSEKPQVFLHPDRFYRKFFPRLKIKHQLPDTAFIRTYRNYLSIGFHLSSPVAQVNFKPRTPAPAGVDASTSFRTNISNVAGFSATYRYITVGFTFRLNTGLNMHSNYAPGYFRTATLKYHNAAYSLQFKYQRIQGFTDVDQTTGVGPNPSYSKRPDIVDKAYQFVGIYNFGWRKYSYLGPLSFSQRQVRSRAGFLLKAGAYYNLLSSDVTLLNPQQQPYYGNFGAVRDFHSVSLKLAPGVGGNLIFRKHIYFSVVSFVSADLFLYNYVDRLNKRMAEGRTFVFALEGLTSAGYQSQRFYAGARFEAERRAGSMPYTNIMSLYWYAGIEMGYRFTTPPALRKFYKKTMPPGM